MARLDATLEVCGIDATKAYLTICETLGIVHDPEGHNPEPGPLSEVLAEIRRLQAVQSEVYELRDRIQALDDEQWGGDR